MNLDLNKYSFTQKWYVGSEIQCNLHKHLDKNSKYAGDTASPLGIAIIFGDNAFNRFPMAKTNALEGSMT